jgi:aminopeptidase
MSDPRIEKWARTLVTYSVAVKPGQTVAISAGVAAEPLIRALYREIVKAGGCPIVLPTFSGLAAELLNNGSDEQLSYISPVERFMREQTDVMIAIMADTNTKAMASVDPARQQFYSGARRELFDTYMQRSADGSLNWTLTLFPTNAYAQDADMSTEDFEEFVFRAGKLHTDDPVAAWKAETEFAQKIVDWLDGKKEIHLTGPGTDLTVDVTDRIWINSGDATKNFPDGEVFTGPVETGVNGTVSFSFPVVTAGREIEGIILTFEQGKVVKATATRGQEYLEAVLDTDEGARYLGEFAIGTNFDIQRFSKNILFDEKIGGTVHMAIGAGYPETGNTNKSAVHWDMICDLRKGGEVRADGELLLKDGKFVV